MNEHTKVEPQAPDRDRIEKMVRAGTASDATDQIFALEKELAALRAEREALMPALRFAWKVLHGEWTAEHIYLAAKVACLLQRQVGVEMPAVSALRAAVERAP